MNVVQSDSWVETHPVTQQDKAAMAAMRAIVEPNKGRMQGTAARDAYDGIMNKVKAPLGVTFHKDKLGDVSGWWCRPANFQPGKAIVHLHGGWFNWGSALAFRNFVGQIAAQAEVEAFIPEYRLAPEHPFPAAIEDAQSCYRELVNRGTTLVALTGDSAGGGLALSLLAIATNPEFSNGVTPVGAVVLSPVTDLTLSGQSWQSRAAADPYFIQSQAAGLVKAYLAGADPNNPMASPLYGSLAGLPPIRVQVGDDEVLLDDSRRYVERAIEAGVDAKLDVWEGMPHGFLGGIGTFNASAQALEAIGDFLAAIFAKKYMNSTIADRTTHLLQLMKIGDDAFIRMFDHMQGKEGVQFARKEGIARWALVHREHTPIVERGAAGKKGLPEPVTFVERRAS